MRIVLGVLAIIGAVCLQLSWFGHLRPFGIMPNLVLVTIVAFSLWANASSALAAALGAGLLLDMSSGSDFGLRIAFFVVVVLAVVAAKQLGLQADSVAAVAAIALIAALLYDLMVLAALRAPLAISVMIQVAIGALLAAVVAIIVLMLRTLYEGRRRTLQPNRDLWQ